MKDTWNELLEFESKDLLQNFFKERHSSEINDWKVQEVSSNIIQAREYFASARKANITVKPLLLYYGVMSLSRALVLSLEPKSRETTLKASHGLSVTNWQSVIQTKNFENLEIIIGEGGFSELINATKNENYLRIDTDAVNWKAGLTIPQKDYRVTFRSVFPYLPDLSKEYKSWTGSTLPYAIISVNGLKIENEKLSVSLANRDLTDELIDAIFPTTYCAKS